MSINVDPAASVSRAPARMTPMSVPVVGSAFGVFTRLSGRTAGVVVRGLRVTFWPSTELQKSFAAVGTQFEGGGVPQLLFSAVGTQFEGGGEPQLLFSAVATQFEGRGVPQLLFSAVGSQFEGGGVPQLMFSAVCT